MDTMLLATRVPFKTGSPGAYEGAARLRSSYVCLGPRKKRRRPQPPSCADAETQSYRLCVALYPGPFATLPCIFHDVADRSAALPAPSACWTVLVATSVFASSAPY